MNFKYLCLLFCVGFVMSCAKESTKQQKKGLKFTLTFKVNSYAKKSMKKAETLADKFKKDVQKVTRAKVTIRGDLNTDLGINKNVYKVTKTVSTNEAVFSFEVDELEVAKEKYRITYLKFIDDANTDIFYIPDEDDPNKGDSKYTLPIYFDLEQSGASAKITYKDSKGKELDDATVPLVKDKGASSIPNTDFSLGFVKSYSYTLYTVNNSANQNEGPIKEAVVVVSKQEGASGNYKVIFSNDSYYSGGTNVKHSEKISFRFRDKDDDKYKFEIAKPGYETKELAARNSSVLKAMTKMEKIIMTQSNVYLREEKTLAPPSKEVYSIGGANFREYDTVYWNNLPEKEGAGLYTISKSTQDKEGSINMDKLETTFDLPLGIYEVEIRAYENNSTQGLLVLAIGSAKYYLKKGASGDGTTLSKAALLQSSGATDLTFRLGSSSAKVSGKFAISVNDADNDKVIFGIIKVEKKD